MCGPVILYCLRILITQFSWPSERAFHLESANRLCSPRANSGILPECMHQLSPEASDVHRPTNWMTRPRTHESHRERGPNLVENRQNHRTPENHMGEKSGPPKYEIHDLPPAPTGQSQLCYSCSRIASSSSNFFDSSLIVSLCRNACQDSPPITIILSI